MKRVLVTGGAGYIGACTAQQLIDAGHAVVVIDNLCSGQRWAVPQQAQFVHGDITDSAALDAVIASQKFDAVLHFAAHVVVPESVADPGKYYRNNVVGSLRLIKACVDAGVEQFIFSSSAAVYGAPDTDKPIREDAATAPINPYGASKLMTEWMLRDLAAASGLRYVALRYFNVAGARMDGTLGQASPQATHLIKVACEAAVGARVSLQIFGDDYPTADGTCVRDYIHVEDLARAHLDALAYLDGGGNSTTLNCGYGIGHSVAEVIACMKKVSGNDFAVEVQLRRAGDPSALVADNALIRERLDWQPRHDDLETICASAYRWEQKLKRWRERDA